MLSPPALERVLRFHQWQRRCTLAICAGVLAGATSPLLAQTAPLPLPTEMKDSDSAASGWKAALPTWLKLSFVTDFRASVIDRKSTLLVPKNLGLQEAKMTGFAKTVVNADATFGALRASVQLRGMAGTQDGHDASIGSLDEAYLEYGFTPTVLGFAGRRNLAFGKAYSVSPLDVFLSRQPLDRSLNVDSRRKEVKGIDSVGVNAFFDNYSVLALFAPGIYGLNGGSEDRALLKLDAVFPKIDSDATLLLYWGHNPRVGLGFSKTIGQSLVVYMEDTLQRGNDVKAITALDFGAPGRFVSSEARHGAFNRFTGGIGYTFESGIGVNLEYINDQTGFSRKQWATISQLAQTNSALLGQSVYQRLGQGNLLTLNGLMRNETVRQNYGFFRAVQDKVLFDTARLEFTHLQSLDDGSGVSSFRFENNFTPSLTGGIFASHSFGNSHSEFGMRTGHFRLVGYVTSRF